MNLRTLYTKHLIPAAQLLMVMSATYRGAACEGKARALFPVDSGARTINASEVLAQFLHDSLDTLNLVNCEVQSWPANLPDLEARAYAASEAVDLLMRTWHAELRNWSALSNVPLQVMATNSVLGTWKEGHRQLNRSIVMSLCELTTRQRPALEVVYRAISYVQKARSQWLAKRALRTAVLAPKGRISAWQTLARNAPWNDTLAYLGMHVETCSVTRFGSFEGRLRLEALMAEAFHEVGSPFSIPPLQPEGPVQKVAEAPETKSTTVEKVAEQASADVLPRGIRVESTPEGLLRITATRTPVPDLTEADVALFVEYTQEGVQPNPTQPLLELSSVTTSGPTGFSEAVRAATLWLDEQEDLQAEAARAFDAFKLRKRTLKKLQEAFTDKELAVLKEHFAQTP